MYLTIIFLPLISSLISTYRKNGIKMGINISIINIIITAIQGTIAFYEVSINGSPVTIKIGNWIETSILTIEWSFTFDTLSTSMLIPILYISVQVQIYSKGYMEGDPHISRFFSYLSLFTFFMLILVTGDNLLVIFVGWEGVGLASYLLINFWFTRIAANHAALKAFIMNRVGDWGLTIGMLICISIISDLSMSTIFSISNKLNGDLIFLLTLTLIIGAMAKSAQLGLHTWLPIAMEGPTPVSALIHAATMVTAGVYLIMRFSPLIEWSSTSLILIIWLGGLSALLGAACGLIENDIKRVVAYSTTSQLGYMVMACGLSQYSLSLFHLINHAFFKALLFLSAGAVIHALADQQDMRKMGSLVLLLPYTYLFILIGSLSLMALPFFTGFYSKDVILELALVPHNSTYTIGALLALLAAFLTSIYSTRLIILTFLSNPRFPSSLITIIHDPHSFMFYPLIIGFFASIFFGYLTHELFLEFGSNFYNNAIFTHPNHIHLLDGSLNPNPSLLLKLLPSTTLLIFFSLFPFSSNSITNTNSNPNPNPKTNFLINTSSNNFIKDSLFLRYFDNFYYWIILFSFKSGLIIHRYWDRGLIELIGPYGLFRLFHFYSFKIELLATSFFTHYVFILIFFPLFIFILFAFNLFSFFYIFLLLFYIFLI